MIKYYQKYYHSAPKKKDFWLYQIELQKAEAKAKKGKIKDSYIEQLRIQTDHFKRFFNGERTTFVKTIQTELEKATKQAQKQQKAICPKIYLLNATNKQSRSFNAPALNCKIMLYFV